MIIKKPLYEGKVAYFPRGGQYGRISYTLPGGKKLRLFFSIKDHRSLQLGDDSSFVFSQEIAHDQLPRKGDKVFFDISKGTCSRTRRKLRAKPWCYAHCNEDTYVE